MDRIVESAKPVFGRRTPNLSIELAKIELLSRRKGSISARVRPSIFMDAPPRERATTFPNTSRRAASAARDARQKRVMLKREMLEDSERRGTVLRKSRDTDRRPGRLRLRSFNGRDLHWRRDQFRNGQKRLPVR